MVVLLFCLIPFDQTIHTHVDLIEVNTVYSGTEGEFSKHFTQLIFWEYTPETGYRVRDWRMVRKPNHIPHKSNGRWICICEDEDGTLRKITAPACVESHWFHDREIDDKRKWPESSRRKLPKRDQ